jgi:hypothetical protein
MVQCANGHANSDAALFCSTCGLVMPPVRRAEHSESPPPISWRDSAGEPDDARSSLELEAFGADDEAAPESPGELHRRRRPRRSRLWIGNRAARHAS